MKFTTNVLYREDIERTIDNVKGFEKLNNKRVLVYGADGMIGTFIVDCLMYANETKGANICIWAVGRRKEELEDRFGEETWLLKYIEIDGDLEWSCSEDVDYVIYASRNDYPKAFRFQPAKGCRMLYISGGEMYNISLKEIPYGVDVVTARLCQLISPYSLDVDDNIATQFIKLATQGKEIVLNGEGNQGSAYCYISDCVSAVMKILLNGEGGQVYDIATDEVVSVKKFVEICAGVVSQKVTVTSDDNSEKPGHMPIQEHLLDNSLLKGLGWSPCYTIKAGIGRSIDIINGIERDKNIIKAINAKHVWIYGAGIVGSRAVKELNKCNNRVDGIVISGRGEHEPIEGYTVRCIDDISVNPDTLFLVAVSAKYQDEVVEALESRGYYNYITWNKFSNMIWYLTDFGFINRKKDSSKVCFVLSGYKEFLWDSVFGRLKRFVPDDVEVCILSSGVYNGKLESIAEDNGWSYLHTALNDLTLVQNIALYIFDKAEWVYKMDEDMFLTDGCFDKMYETYERVRNGEPYHVGFVGPLIPVNGYGYIHILEKYSKLGKYEEVFEKARFGGSIYHQLENNPEAARFMWGDGSGLPYLDEMNREAGTSDEYSVCGVRFSIGFILYKREFWQLMRGYGISGTTDMGRDESEIGYNCVEWSKAIIVAHNTVVGHFSFGPQTEAMKEFYHDNPEYFEIREV
jgi:hypothetical protein